MSILDALQGILSGNGNSTMPAPYYADPRIAMYSSIARSIAPYAGASRLPISNGQALAAAGGGVAPGQAQGVQEQAQNLANFGAEQRVNLLNGILGGGQPQQGSTPQMGSAPTTSGAPITAAATGNSPPMGASLLSGNNNPVAGALVADLLGQTYSKYWLQQHPGPTDAQRALTASGIDPNTPQGQTMLRDAAIKASGIDPVIGGQRPGVLPQYYNPSTGRYEADTSALAPMEAGSEAAARGRAQGELGAKEAEDAFKAGLDVKVSNTTQRLKTFYDTGTMPPDAINPQATQPQQGPKGEVATPQGTVVPSPPKGRPFAGVDAITKMNANTAETEKNFTVVRQTMEGTQSRLVALGKALQTVQSGGLNEKRAEIANVLRGAGFGSAADIVMSDKDTAAVQTAIGLQVLDVLGQLKQVNQGSGGRILNSEFVNLLSRQYGPDLSPQANYDLITQALGGVEQTMHMIDDYQQFGKPMGWRDANQFISSWYNQPSNKMDAMVKRAGEEIGPLKGMAGNAGEGATATVNGKVYVKRGGQWYPQ